MSRELVISLKPRVGWPTVAAWAIPIVVICALAYWRPTTRTVFIAYATAGRDWIESKDCYQPRPMPQGGYRYSPTLSVALVPFGMLPDSLGAVLWRLGAASLVVFSFAVGVPFLIGPARTPTVQETRWLWLLLVPFTMANLYNGQANLHVMSLCLLGAATGSRGRWTISAVCLVAACFIKVYPIALALLMTAVMPAQLGLRLIAVAAVGAALPFLTQSPDYVIDEYRNWFLLMTQDDRFHPDFGTSYRDAAMLLHRMGAPVTRQGFLLIQVATGLSALALILWKKLTAEWPTARTMRACYFLGTFWMVLFGPATESSTYILLAPAAASLVINSLNQTIREPARWCVWIGSMLIYLALFCSIFPFGSTVHNWAVQPLGAFVLLVGFLLAEFLAVNAPHKSAQPVRTVRSCA